MHSVKNEKLWSRNFPKTVEGPTNHFSRWTVTKGNVEDGFTQADRILDTNLRFP